MSENIIFDRDELSEGEKQLFLADIKKVCSEYFENEGRFSLDITRTEGGFSVCLIFDARRIKRFRKPM